MDESLTGKTPFKPLGLPHRITSSNSATNLHGTDEPDDHERDGRVLVLLTGGTMGMKPNARGSLEPKAGYLAEQMRLMPELRERRVHVTQDDFEMAVAKVMKKDVDSNLAIKKLWK